MCIMYIKNNQHFVIFHIRLNSEIVPMIKIIIIIKVSS